MVLATMYAVVGMQIGTEGMKMLNAEKLAVAAYLMDYATLRMIELMP